MDRSAATSDQDLHRPVCRSPRRARPGLGPSPRPEPADATAVRGDHRTTPPRTGCGRRYPHPSTGTCGQRCCLKRSLSGRPHPPEAPPHRASSPGLPTPCCGRTVADPSNHLGQVYTVVHVAVDNCGRRASACGRSPSPRWTTCGENTGTHRSCDLPTTRPRPRPHAENAADLRKQSFSTVCTTPMTTTNNLSRGKFERLHQAWDVERAGPVDVPLRPRADSPHRQPSRFLLNAVLAYCSCWTGRRSPTRRHADRTTRTPRTPPSSGAPVPRS